MRQVLSLAIVILVSSGCGVRHIQALRDAEAVFNRASEADNRHRFSGATGVTNAASALADYRLAARMLEELIRRERPNLERDKLLCTAVAVQALSLWRVGEHDGALSTAGSAKGCLDTTEAAPAPRDSALIRAIPGLVRIDQAKAKVDNGKPGDLASIEQLVTDAHRDLSDAGRFVPSDHPLREYLLLTHLAATRVLQESITAENLTGPDLKRIAGKVTEQGTCWVRAYRCHLQRASESADNERRIAFWNQLLGVSVAQGQTDCVGAAACTP